MRLELFFIKLPAIKALTTVQRNYSTYGRELIAIFQAIRFFRYYLDGGNFTRTQHVRFCEKFGYKTSPLDVSGEDNNVVDSTRFHQPYTNFEQMSLEQANNPELQEFLQHPEKSCVQASN